MFNVVLIILGQHCTGQNPMQCCPRCSRQHCIRKSPVQCRLNTPGTILHRKNSMQCCPRGFKQHCTGKIQAMSSEQHLITLFTYTFYSETGQTSSHTLSKQIKLSPNHAMFPKPMQSCLAVSVKYRDQDCISR